MADHAAANEDIWPSQNDVAQTVGNGKKLLENQWEQLAKVPAVNNYSLSGLTVPGSSGTLNINVALGTAYIAGRWISIPGATSVTAAPSSTNYVFLKLVRDGSNLVTGAVFEVNTTGVAPANSTPIAILTAGASTITATTDKRILPTTIEFLTSGTSWTFPAGITRIYVEVYGASGGGGGGGSGSDGSGPGGPGSAGTAGGTTTFGALTANGGALGPGGGGGSETTAVDGVDGTATGGIINLTGLGLPGGIGGAGGGGAGVSPSGSNGGNGGRGGFSAGFVTGAVGSAVSYAIGSAGALGAGAGGNGGGSAGTNGTNGHAGRIVIRYFP